MTDGYWDGALWVYQADITNGAGGGGDLTWTVVPGVGNEMEILYGDIFNGDTAGRVVRINIDDGTNHLASLLDDLTGFSLNAGVHHAFPIGDVVAATGGNVSDGARILIAGTMRLVATVESVAASQDGAFALVARIRGGVPVVTEAGNSTPTININTEQVF